MAPALVVHAVDAAIAVLLVEAVVLAALGRGPRARHGLPSREIGLIAAAGLGLLIALRAALAGAHPGIVLAGLTLGGLAHAADLAARLARSRSDQKR